MDMTCRCKKDYTCVACRVKRGDYRDWVEIEKVCSEADCGRPSRSLGLCTKHYYRQARALKRSA